MFETLHPLDADQVEIMATELMAGSHALVMMDPVGICMFIRPVPDKPYAVDFACVLFTNGQFVQAPLLPMQWAVANEWMAISWKAIHKKWRELGEVPGE